jgi:transposase InsO family protein
VSALRPLVRILRPIVFALVWWLRLGIASERMKLGKPQQNGRHERMHLTLKTETTRPPGINSLQQQARFDAFRQKFNTERPHEAL